MHRFSPVTIALCALTAACACRRASSEPSSLGRAATQAPMGCPTEPDGQARTYPHARVAFVGHEPAASVVAEVVKSGPDAERGLMYRTSLPYNEGMLFQLGGPVEHVFWMKNTCIPLDMIFIDSTGIIVGILEDVAPLSSRAQTVGVPSVSVLEVNAGWSRRHGVRVGEKVEVEVMRER